MDPIRDAHVKLLARDLLALTRRPSTSSDPPSFSTPNGRPVSRSEAIGVVVARDRREKYLRFLVDDGTGCVPCILWLNHRLLLLRSDAGGGGPVPRFLAGRSPSEIEMLGSFAEREAERVQLGALVRVRGRVTAYRGAVQLTVEGVAAERDPNAEVLHWLQCVRLGRCCYGLSAAATTATAAPPTVLPVPSAPAISRQENNKRKAPIV